MPMNGYGAGAVNAGYTHGQPSHHHQHHHHQHQHPHLKRDAAYDLYHQGKKIKVRAILVVVVVVVGVCRYDLC